MADNVISGIQSQKVSISKDYLVTEAIFKDIYYESTHGAAINISGGVVAIEKSEFTGNTCAASRNYGGAIYIGSGEANISDSVFSGNSAWRGGAINSRGTLTVKDSSFSGNKANYYGAIHVTSAGSLALTGKVDFLTETDRVNCDGVMTINNATLQLNADMSMSNGAAVTNSTFNFGNSVDITIGALNFADPANCAINFAGSKKVTFAADQSLKDVAITVDGTNYLADGTYTIAENVSDVAGAKLNASTLGFITQTLNYSGTTLSLTVENTAISAALVTAGENNYVKIGDAYYAGQKYASFGDALAATDVDAYVADGVTFTERYEFNKPQVIINNVTIADIASQNLSGGGLYISGGSTRITNSKFSNIVVTRNNSTNYYGGAIYVGSANVYVSGTEFSGNKNIRGGAIFVNNGGTLTVKDSTFSGNSSYAVWNHTGSKTDYTGTVRFTTSSDTLYVHADSTVSFTDANIYLEASIGSNNVSTATLTVKNSQIYFTNDNAISLIGLNFTDQTSSVNFTGSQKVTFAADQSLKDVAITVDGTGYLTTGTYTIAENVVDVADWTFNASKLEYVTQTLTYDSVNKALKLDVKNSAVSAALFDNNKTGQIKIGDTTYVGKNYDTWTEALAADDVTTYVADGVTFTGRNDINRPLIIYNNVKFADISGVNTNGGAINIAGGSVRIIDSEFSNVVMTRDNSSTYYGGAIQIGGANVYISGTQFSGNKNIRGGAIFVNNGGTLTVKDSTFSGNSSYAVWNHTGSKTDYTGTVRFTTSSDAIYVHANSTVSFTDANIYMEAGIGSNDFTTASVTVTNTQLNFTNDSAITLTKLNFADKNSSVNFAGSQKVTFAANQSLKDVAITVDGSAYAGAGSYIIAENVIDVGAWTFNPSALGYVNQTLSYDSENNVLKLDVNSTATSAALFSNNNDGFVKIGETYYAGVNYDSWENALKATGVNAYIANGVTFTARHGVSKNNVIYNNIVAKDIVDNDNNGGAIVISGGYSKFIDSEFSGNKVTASGTIGGAVYISSNAATAEFSNVTFSENYAAKRGGAINSRGNVILSDVTFSGNSANDDNGGALWINAGTTTLTGDVKFMTVTDTVAVSNNAAMYITNANITLNSYFTCYGQMYLTDSTITLGKTNAFWVDGFTAIGNNVFHFTGEESVIFKNADFSDVTITVDGSIYKGEAVQLGSGVEAFGNYTINNDNADLTLVIEHGNLMLRTADMTSGTQADFTGGTANLMTGGEVTDAFIAMKPTEANTDRIVTTVSGGKISSAMVGGAYAKATDVGFTGATVTRTEVNFGGTADVSAQVYAGGYVYGTGEESNDIHMTVGKVKVNISDGTVSGNIYGGIHARDNANASVDVVEFNVTGGIHGRIYGGGWAERGAQSDVTTSIITIDGGYVDYVYGGGANGSGKTTVGNSTITISGDASVGTIFMSGRYGYSSISGEVYLTFSGDEKIIDRLSGVSSSGRDNAQSTVVELQTALAADVIDFVDKFIINEGASITAYNEFALGNREADGSSSGATIFDFIIDDNGLDDSWEAIAGISNFTNAKFAINGSEAVAWGNGDTLAIGDYILTRDDKLKTITLAQANA